MPDAAPTKLIYPDIRATKRDVWDDYHAVMDHLLPQIVGRLLSIIRCPSGAVKPCFFQKHHTAGLERVSSVKLSEETAANAYYLVVEDAPGLLELVQFNALEFHPWGSHADRPGAPTAWYSISIRVRTCRLPKSDVRRTIYASCWRKWSWNRSCASPEAKVCTWWRP